MRRSRQLLSTSFLGCCFSQHALIKFVPPLRHFLDSSTAGLQHGRSYLATFAGNRKRRLSARRAARPVSTTETYSRRETAGPSLGSLYSVKPWPRRNLVMLCESCTRHRVRRIRKLRR